MKWEQRTSAECLEQCAKECCGAYAGGEGQHTAFDGVVASGPQGADEQHDERQQLQRMQPDKVRNTKIAAARAPVRHRHADAAIGRANRVGTTAKRGDAGTNCSKLRQRRYRHDPADGSADDVERQAETQGHAHGAVLQRSADMQHQQHNRKDGHGDDDQAHHLENDVVEERVHIEVTLHTARGLQRNEQYFADEEPSDGSADAADA